jgi:RNA polymerase sigma factor (sigma-70 family)
MDADEPVIYCIVPADLGRRLAGGLERLYGADPAVVVLIDRRKGERRHVRERRTLGRFEPRTSLRLITNPDGRRIADRRRDPAPTIDAMPLPRGARRHADGIRFVGRVRAVDDALEDVATARCITRIQAGDPEALERLYKFWFDRLYGFFGIVCRRSEDIEPAVQEAFTRVFASLADYDYVDSAFRVWLARVLLPMYAEEMPSWGKAEPEQAAPTGAESPLAWIPDSELVVLLGTLPSPRREVLALHYVIGLSPREIALVLGASVAEVADVHERALRFINACAISLGRRPGYRGRHPMRAQPRPPVTQPRRFAGPPRT